jgi:hypothetical protein
MARRAARVKLQKGAAAKELKEHIELKKQPFPGLL